MFSFWGEVGGHNPLYCHSSLSYLREVIKQKPNQTCTWAQGSQLPMDALAENSMLLYQSWAKGPVYQNRRRRSGRYCDFVTLQYDVTSTHDLMSLTLAHMIWCHLHTLGFTLGKTSKMSLCHAVVAKKKMQRSRKLAEKKPNQCWRLLERLLKGAI